jgi:hypothetical protein
MRALLVVVLMIAVHTSLPGQTACCRISGAITDPAGLPVAGATVVLQKPDGSAVRSISSTESGAFAFPAVPKGDYSLSVSSGGMEPYEKKITLQRDVTGINVPLQLADVSSAVTVTESAAAVDLAPQQNLNSVELERETLENLPALDGDVLGAAAEFLDEGFVGPEGPTLVVDGVETSDIGVTSSAIQEVRINRNPYSAEYSRPGSSRIEVITKQGTTDFHGDLRIFLRDFRLDARNAFAATRPEQQRRVYEGSLTGPLGKSGKTTFVVSAEREEDDQQSIVYAQLPGGLHQENVPQPERDNEFSARVNRYHNDRHVFSWRYRYEKEVIEGLGIGGLVLPEAGYIGTEASHRYYFNHRWFATPQLFTELSLRFGTSEDTVEPYNPDATRIVVQDAFTTGGAQRNSFTSRKSAELAYTASWSKNNHMVRAGVLLPNLDGRSLDDRDNFGGTYTFASLTDYEAGRPLSYTQNIGQPRLNYDTYAAALFVQDDFQIRPNLTLGAGLRWDWQNAVSDANNFAPRVSLAWGIGGDRKTVLRTGFGVFYDRLRANLLADALRLDGIRVRQLYLIDPPYPDPGVAGNPLTIPPTIFRFTENMRSPYLMQTGASLERQITPALTGSLTYSFTRGVSLFRSLDANAPFGPDSLRPLPNYAIIRQLEPSGTLKRHALSVNLRVRSGKFFRGAAIYTLGYASNFTDDEQELPPNSRDLSREWSRAAWDRRHRLRMYGSWQLPAAFSLGTIFSASSGGPYEWTLGEDLNNDGLALERPFGVVRNALEEPGYVRFDLRLSRKFNIGPDGPSLALGIDAFNVLNRVNFTQVVGNESSPFFGQPVAAGPARRLQLSMRLSF